jgi:very-long-chain (3R)-3-hydroxyacyl-CoA dehydratase
VLRLIQTFQLTDILLILIGKSKGSIFGAFFQILGRMIVTWGFVEADSNNLRFATVSIIWALADCNRYLYYLFKNHPLTATLRYNSFILLYPVGVFGEMLLINDYVGRHNELSEGWIYFIRVIQGGIVFGFLFLYAYMLNMRSKYYKKTGGFVNSLLAKPKAEEEQPIQQAASS